MARERMSGVDQAWLRMDGPANRMVIVGLLVLDGRVDRAALASRIRERLLRHARFRQRLEEDAGGHAWVDDESFDLDRHLVAHRLSGNGSPRQLSALVGRLAAEPLDPSRPLWRFDLVENYRGAQALVTRIHHCIADGIALVGVLLSLADDWEPDRGSARYPDGPPRHREDASHGFADLLEPLMDGALGAARIAGRALGASLSGAKDDPARHELLDAGVRLVNDALRIALMTQDSVTPLKGRPGGRKAFAWNEPISLDEVKAVCKVLGVSVNDVLLSCVAGALHRYLEGIGHATAGQEIRAMVPVNLRPPQDEPTLGNRFGLVPLVLPVGIANPVERVFEVRRRMDALKGGYQGLLAFALLSVLGHAPAQAQRIVFDYLAHKGTAVMTNVPGPARALAFLGARISQAMFWVPQSGTIGLGVSVLSYDGGVQFGVVADTAICPRPQAIVDAFAPEFERLLLTLSMLPRELVESGRFDGPELERNLFDAAARRRSRKLSGRRSPSRA